MKYLDETGLTHLWNKIKTYVDSHGGGGSTSWIELGHKTGTTAFNIDTSGCNEILIFAETSRNNAWHYYSAVMPVARLKDTMYEIKLGGGYASSSTNTLTQVKVSKTQAQLVNCLINGTNYATTCTVYIYGR